MGTLLELALCLLAGAWLAWARWLIDVMTRPRPVWVQVTDPHGLTVAEFARDLNRWDREGRP